MGVLAVRRPGVFSVEVLVANVQVFEGSHKFLFSSEHDEAINKIVSSLLPDEMREVSNASMAALTGILAATPLDTVRQCPCNEIRCNRETCSSFPPHDCKRR